MTHYPYYATPQQAWPLTRPGSAEEPEMTVQEARILGGIMAGVGLFFAVLFAIPPFLPRAMWAWIIGIIAIAFGLTSPCLWPLCIPLLIFYVNAHTRAWYGVGAGA